MTRLIRLRKKEEDGLNTAKTVHVELGNKYFESAEYEKALIEYKKALERDPNDVMSLFQFCKSAEKTNSFYELKRASLWLFSRICKDYDSGNLKNDILVFFGKCCQYELNFDKAECYYKEAIGDYSEDEFYRLAYEALIECYKEKGDKISLKHAERLYARFLD